MAKIMQPYKQAEQTLIFFFFLNCILITVAIFFRKKIAIEIFPQIVLP